jgi:hypothetical protein
MSLAVLSSSGYTILNEWDRIAGEQPLARPPVLSTRRQSLFVERGASPARGSASGARACSVSYCSVNQGSGRSSRSRTSRLPSKMTAQSRLCVSTCAIISRHRPQGATRTPPLETATTASMCVSLALSISATAATSAQKPSPHAKSMQMPVYMFPFAVRRAALTEPAEKSSLNLNAPHTAFAASINFDLASFMSFVSPNH